MKIKRSQLKRIIEEELQQVLMEQLPPVPVPYEEPLPEPPSGPREEERRFPPVPTPPGEVGVRLGRLLDPALGARPAFPYEERAPGWRYTYGRQEHPEEGPVEGSMLADIQADLEAQRATRGQPAFRGDVRRVVPVEGQPAPESTTRYVRESLINDLTEAVLAKLTKR